MDIIVSRSQYPGVDFGAKAVEARQLLDAAVVKAARTGGRISPAEEERLDRLAEEAAKWRALSDCGVDTPITLTVDTEVNDARNHYEWEFAWVRSNVAPPEVHPPEELGEAGQSYRVQDGDTIVGIAAANGIANWRDLVEWNNLEIDERIIDGRRYEVVNIQPGQILSLEPPAEDPFAEHQRKFEAFLEAHDWHPTHQGSLSFLSEGGLGDYYRIDGYFDGKANIQLEGVPPHEATDGFGAVEMFLGALLNGPYHPVESPNVLSGDGAPVFPADGAGLTKLDHMARSIVDSARALRGEAQPVLLEVRHPGVMFSGDEVIGQKVLDVTIDPEGRGPHANTRIEVVAGQDFFAMEGADRDADTPAFTVYVSGENRETGALERVELEVSERSINDGYPDRIGLVLPDGRINLPGVPAAIQRAVDGLLKGKLRGEDASAGRPWTIVGSGAEGYELGGPEGEYFVDVPADVARLINANPSLGEYQGGGNGPRGAVYSFAHGTIAETEDGLRLDWR